MVKQTIRAGDVFSFSYHSTGEQGWDSRTHCFEGTLIAQEVDDRMILVDTYWGIGDTSGRRFSLEDAEKQGTLTFRFSLNDVEPIQEWEREYYADDDIFRISRQHACIPSCVAWYKRTGVQRSRDKILDVLRQKIHEQRREIECAVGRIERLAGVQAKVEAGDTNVYI